VIILGIETSTARVGAALGGVEGVLAELHSTRDRRHAEALTPAIETVCRMAHVAMDEISVVAVDIGPGLFTGLRVGVATAKAVAQALRVPMIGLSSLDLLAFSVRYTDRLVVPVVDARRGEVYCATYRHVPGGIQRLTPYRVCTPQELAGELLADGRSSLLIGDGALRYAGLLGADSDVEIGTVGTAYPSPGALVELAHPRAVREQFVQPSELGVLYLRRSDAEINWDARHRGGRDADAAAG
jgi:tRNA threonylcarbamoyladenosine biosynthesis protein TsaB